MQNWLLEDIGNELAKKPFERVSWFCGTKWSVFISLDSPLTLNNPLWNRDESDLENVRLFGLSPNELQAEIIRYWQHAFWKRWLLSLFTPIHNKITLWSYYQRCLSFHEVYIKNPFDEKDSINFVFEQYLGRVATQGLNKCRIQFENYLEKHAGNLKWIQNNEIFICQYFKKDWEYFVKSMNKRLIQLVNESDRNELRSQLEMEYIRLQDILFRYLVTWRKKIFNPLTFTFKRISSSDALVYVDSPIEKKSNYLPSNTLADNKICSIHSVDDWVKMKRQRIESLLQSESPEQFFKLKNLLESCFSAIKIIIDSQLKEYKKMLDKARWNPFDCAEASRQADSILTGLIYFFRKSVLLFHPDKSFGNGKLQEIQTELFKIFQELSKESLEEIKKGFPILQANLSKQRNIQECWEMKQEFDLRTEKMEQQLEEMKASLEETKARWKQDFTEMKENLKKTYAEMKDSFNKTRIEIEEMKIKIDNFIKLQTYSNFLHKPSSNSVIREENVVQRMSCKV